MSIYRRKSGRFAVLIDLDPTAAGLRRRRSVGTFRTRKEAERAERQALEARDRGIDLSPKTVTVSELLDRYLGDREALGRGAKTLQEYRSYADRLVRPHLGGITLAKLRPVRIAEWRDELLARGGKPVKDKDGNLHDRPLSPKTVYHAFTLLNGALRFALRMDLVGRNPCEAVTRPSVHRSDATAIAPGQVTSLLDTARGTRWEGFVTLALTTGCRRGELCGLSWSDYDAANATLTIRHSLSQTRAGVVLKAPKTNTVRTLPLSRMATEALKAQRVLQAKERLAAGAFYQNVDEAIFADELGRRITPMAATCAFERIARKAGISTTRLHDCRHTAATTLLLAGVDVRTTAGVLGHASPTITLSTYAHLMPEAQRDAVERLGERLEKLAAKGV